MTRRRLMWIDGWAVAATLWVLGGLVYTLLLTWSLTAHGQATQPASAPAVFVPVAGGRAWAWLVANSGWLVPLAGNVLASVAVGLKRFPKARGLVRVLWMIVGWFSSVEFRDGKKPGLAFKLPLTLPAPPPDGAREI